MRLQVLRMPLPERYHGDELAVAVQVPNRIWLSQVCLFHMLTTNSISPGRILLLALDIWMIRLHVWVCVYYGLACMCVRACSHVRVHVCVCVRERERECVCVCVCVRACISV